MSTTKIDVELAVNEKYSHAAQMRVAELCCPVQYDPKYLDLIPDEIKERDYGCGDPSTFVRKGDRVLDLGSGAGKVCYVAAQITGAEGYVIGVDANDEMLALAQKYRGQFANQLGYHNVEFRKGRIQDLGLDLWEVETYLSANPIRSVGELTSFENYCSQLRNERPLIPDESVDIVLSNCVLNLVQPADKEKLFSELFRVVRRGGRVAISDIVSDETVPEELQTDKELWAGCIAGAYREDLFLEAFENAGFYGMEIVKRDEQPWRTLRGIQFRSVTVLAYKGKQGPCWERKQAVVYRGPWRKVFDDDGHVLERGKRMAVCDKTFQLFNREPYAIDIFPVEPLSPIPLAEATEFDCKRSALRHPRETKGLAYDITYMSGAECCDPGSQCC